MKECALVSCGSLIKHVSTSTQGLGLDTPTLLTQEEAHRRSEFSVICSGCQAYFWNSHHVRLCHAGVQLFWLQNYLILDLNFATGDSQLITKKMTLNWCKNIQYIDFCKRQCLTNIRINFTHICQSIKLEERGVN